MIETSESLLHLWFGEDIISPDAVAARRRMWFEGDASFDDLLRRRFADLPQRALGGELDAWRDEPRSSLALVLVLDQLPRNLHRGTGLCFAYDSAAHDAAADAIDQGFDSRLAPLEAMFLYLPFEHAESSAAQERSVSLFRGLVERGPAQQRRQFESFLSYAIRHQRVIDRFGRFPHRNGMLERATTAEEQAYLDSGGETFDASDEDV